MLELGLEKRISSARWRRQLQRGKETEEGGREYGWLARNTGLAKFAKRPREDGDDYTRKGSGMGGMGTETGKKYSIKRNGGLANIYLSVGLGAACGRSAKSHAKTFRCRMALVAAQKRGKFS